MKFEIAKTKHCPHVVVDHAEGYILIEECTSFDVDTYLPQISDAIMEYLQQPQPKTLMVVRSIIYPESRKGNIRDLFKRIRDHFKENQDAFLCEWHYEEGDTDMLDDGEFFAQTSRLHFKFIEEPD